MEQEKGEEDTVRLVLFVLFWVGLFATLREMAVCQKARCKHITRADKLLLVLALPLGLVAQLAVELAGFGTRLWNHRTARDLPCAQRVGDEAAD